MKSEGNIEIGKRVVKIFKPKRKLKGRGWLRSDS
jgi:hypothetical protein